MLSVLPLRSCAASFVALVSFGAAAQAQCVENGPIQNYTGAGTITCPCFVQNEEALAIISSIPAGQFPIEITKIAIGWGSAAGGALPAVEDSLVLYNGNPSGGAAPAFQFFAPQLTDGFINEFDVEPLGPNTITSTTFAVGLRFFNDTNLPSGGVYPPSIVEDSNGCQPGKNKVKVVSGLPPGFYDACALGVSGDWVIYVKYKSAGCGGGGPVGNAYCFGDGTGATLCPCDPGQSGGPGEGCANSFGTGGKISATGTAQVSNDTVVLNVQGLPPTVSSLFFQGLNQQNGGNGAAFGDGLLCVSGSIIRLGTRVTTAGQANFGAGIPGDPLISVRGMLPGGGGTRNYQVWYRNAAAFCTPSVFNLSNGLQIVWAP